MPKIKLALYDHPFRAGLESIRASKTEVTTGWVASQDLCVELIDLGDEPLTQKEEILVFKVLRAELTKHFSFPISIGPVCGVGRGDPDGVGDDALSEARLYIRSDGAIEALRKNIAGALKKAGFSRPIDTYESTEQALTPQGEVQKPGPFMIIAKMPIDEMTDAHISAANKLAFYLSKFVIMTPVCNIVLDPDFGGAKYLLKLKELPKKQLELPIVDADATFERKHKADVIERSEPRNRPADALLRLSNDISVNLGKVGDSFPQLVRGLAAACTGAPSPASRPSPVYAPPLLSPVMGMSPAPGVGVGAGASSGAAAGAGPAYSPGPGPGPGPGHAQPTGPTPSQRPSPATLLAAESNPMEALSFTTAYTASRLKELKPNGKLTDDEYQAGMVAIQAELAEMQRKHR